MCPSPEGEDAKEHEEGIGEAGDGEAGAGKSSTVLKHPEGSKSSEEETGGAVWVLLSGAVKKSSS